MTKLCESVSSRAGDPVIFKMTLGERDQICMGCPLAECVGIESRECPIQVEQRRRWSEEYKRRKAAGYFAARNQRQKQNKPRKERGYDVRICR